MKRSLLLALLCFFVVAPLNFTSCFPESAVHQKKIDHDRRIKEKEARKAYELDLKKHHKNQTKETRARMRQTKKNAKRVTPLKK
ncbi:MAG: hypothetical protein D4R67_08385 [Bacteroidetes bacterium]|nr:MAG: hypothetical protein D4R67_08385 [Bacteroidota bacterium]